jgi:hypothetical protein
VRIALRHSLRQPTVGYVSSTRTSESRRGKTERVLIQESEETIPAPGVQWDDCVLSVQFGAMMTGRQLRLQKQLTPAPRKGANLFMQSRPPSVVLPH